MKKLIVLFALSLRFVSVSYAEEIMVPKPAEPDFVCTENSDSTQYASFEFYHQDKVSGTAKFFDVGCWSTFLMGEEKFKASVDKHSGKAYYYSTTMFLTVNTSGKSEKALAALDEAEDEQYYEAINNGSAPPIFPDRGPETLLGNYPAKAVVVIENAEEQTFQISEMEMSCSYQAKAPVEEKPVAPEVIMSEDDAKVAQ